MEYTKMSDEYRIKMIEIYNHPHIKPMIDETIKHICYVGAMYSVDGIDYDAVYNYLLFGDNKVNPNKPYSFQYDNNIVGLLNTSIRAYNNLVYNDTPTEDKDYFLRKIKLNIHYDDSDNRSKIIYGRFIVRCVENLTII